MSSSPCPGACDEPGAKLLLDLPRDLLERVLDILRTVDGRPTADLVIHAHDIQNCSADLLAALQAHRRFYDYARVCKSFWEILRTDCIVHIDTAGPLVSSPSGADWWSHGAQPSGFDFLIDEQPEFCERYLEVCYDVLPSSEASKCVGALSSKMPGERNTTNADAGSSGEEEALTWFAAPCCGGPTFRRRTSEDISSFTGPFDPKPILRTRVFSPGVWHSVKVQINPGGWACYYVDEVFFGSTGLTIGERLEMRRLLATLSPRAHIGMVCGRGADGPYSFRNLFACWRTGRLLPRYVELPDDERSQLIAQWRLRLEIGDCQIGH